MSVFQDYAAYYDLLYRDKDYAAEVDYVVQLLANAGVNTGNILSLGCGTGGHDFELARRGFRVHGVDLSERMIDLAKSKCARLSAELASQPDFSTGDIRNWRGGDTYDAVISLFHVMSYQNTEEDLSMALQTAREHLKTGGVFLFDCWYGPAVLNDPPTNRRKRLENDLLAIDRYAEPVVRSDDHVVEVHYRVELTEKTPGNQSTIREVHPMRYWFADELEKALNANGFELLKSEHWMTGKPLSDSTWYATLVARAR